MSIHAELPSQKPEQYGSDAFRLEYSKNTPPRAIIKDIESFLGEYIFELTEYDYELSYENGQLLDPYTHEPMISKAYRAIGIKTAQGRITTREEAELAGLANLQTQLLSAKKNDSIIWISPPGPKSEGYGDYGFIYLGKVTEETVLNMTAIRVEKPEIKQFVQFFKLFAPHDSTSPVLAEEFIANPLVLADRSKSELRSLLIEYFLQKAPLEDPYFVTTLAELTPYINKYLQTLQYGAPKIFEQQVFNMLINYSLQIKNALEGEEERESLPFMQAVKLYGESTPRLIGSCGAVVGSANDLFNSLSPFSRVLSENKTHWEYHKGNCVICDSKNAEVGPCNICKQCEKKLS